MNKCACIKGQSFDFALISVDHTKVLYQDMSVWMTGDKYYIPETYDIIMGIGSGKKISVKTGGLTEITSEMLGGLPDGVYCVKASSCMETYTRYKVHAFKIECCIMEYMSQLIEKRARDEEYVEVERIENLLTMAKHNAEVKNTTLAQSLLEEAKLSLEELNCNCNCLKR